MNTPQLPPLPKPDTHCFDEDTGKDVWSHSPAQTQAYAIAAIEAQDNANGVVVSQGVPDGWKLVPDELTREMWAAVNKVDDSAFAGGSMHGADFESLWNAALASAPPAPQQKPMTDEQDRALCEAYCNAASDEYFKARPQLDSDVNRRIFYAGHRKAWIDWQAAHGIKE